MSIETDRYQIKWLPKIEIGTRNYFVPVKLKKLALRRFPFIKFEATRAFDWINMKVFGPVWQIYRHRILRPDCEKQGSNYIFISFGVLTAFMSFHFDICRWSGSIITAIKFVLSLFFEFFCCWWIQKPLWYYSIIVLWGYW